jgi:two-component system, sensor histidine kinase PdtaS
MQGSSDTERHKMITKHSPYRADSVPNIIFAARGLRTVVNCERELTKYKCADCSLLRLKDDLIQQQEVLSKESDHRLLNGLQMIVSLLSLQSRASENAEVALQLAAAADRIATIGRIHRRLHSLDGVQTFAIKQYLEDLCRDFSMMLSSELHPQRVIVVEGIEIELPADTAIPLGFIASELITNAAKYGTGRITVSLDPNPERGYALSVSNDGPGLPDGFDGADHKRLGMRIVRSLVERIGGELQIGQGDRNQGTRFTVLFSRSGDRKSNS